jgi:hypothetical protein
LPIDPPPPRPDTAPDEDADRHEIMEAIRDEERFDERNLRVYPPPRTPRDVCSLEPGPTTEAKRAKKPTQCSAEGRAALDQLRNALAELKAKN